MSQNQRKDPGGELFSWVIILICLAAVWPLGLFLLFQKLKGYASDAGGKTRMPTGTQAPRQTAVPKTSAVPGRSARTQRPGPVRADPKSAAHREPPSPKPGAREAGLRRKRSQGALSVVLLLLAILLVAVGLQRLAPALQALLQGGGAGDFTRALSAGLFYITGGLGTLIVRGGWLRRGRRLNKYRAIIGTRDAVPLSEIAAAAGVSARRAARDLHIMLHNDYFSTGAYIDAELACYVASPEAAATLRTAGRAEKAAPADSGGSIHDHVRILNEMRAQNAAITDPAMCEKLKTLESLTTKIFMAVDESPEKAPQLRKFMSYYLPTTMKLLKSYATLERQDMGGENIAAAKERIHGILDTLIAGYGQQLDRLYRSDMLDIASDIDVLEDMMEMDGLAGSDPFQVSGGH